MNRLKISSVMLLESSWCLYLRNSEVLGIGLSWQSVHSSFQYSTLLNAGTKGGKWNFYFSRTIKLKMLNGSWGCIPVCLEEVVHTVVYTGCILSVWRVHSVPVMFSMLFTSKVHGFASQHGRNHQLKQQLSCLLPQTACLFRRKGCGSSY